MIPEMVIFPTKTPKSGDSFALREEHDRVLLVRPGTMNGSEHEGDVAASKPMLSGVPIDNEECYTRPRSRGRSSSHRIQANARRGSQSNMYLMTAPPLTPRRRISRTSSDRQLRTNTISPTFEKSIVEKPDRKPFTPSDSMSTLLMEESNASLLTNDASYSSTRLGAFLQRTSHRFVGEEDDAGSFAPSVPGITGGGCSVAPSVVSMDCSRTESMSTSSTTPAGQQQQQQQQQEVKAPPPPPLLEDDDDDENDDDVDVNVDVDDDDSEAAATTAPTPMMNGKTKAPRKVFCRRGDKIGSYLHAT